MTDVIRRVNLELDGADPDGLARGRHASRWAEERLVPALEGIVESHSNTDRLVAIDRLDIAIEIAGWDVFEGALLDELRRELSALLTIEVRRSETQPEQRARSGELAPKRAWQPQRALDALRFYLERGRLPWYCTAETFADELAEWLGAAPAETLVAELAPLLAAPAAARRFLRELPEPALVALLERVLGLPAARSRAWAAEVAVLRTFLREALAAAGHLATAVVPPLAVAPGYTLPEALWVALLVEWAREPAIREPYWRAVAAFVESCFAEAQALEWDGEPTRRKANALVLEGVPDVALALPFTTPEFRAALHHARALTDDSRANTEQHQAASSSDAAREGYFVANAGTVLLAPYLRRYLERLGHVRGDRIVDPGAALVAVDFLASGRTGAPREYELVLTKLLCGFGLEEAPPRLTAPDARTRDEADALLASIIEHWAVLRNTSVTGLREGFLQREGKLSLSPRNNWLLQVEQKAYDLLLGQLPWSYRMIQLPWMERMLVTEWVD